MQRNEIWLANITPQRGTEVGKVRPVLIIQTDLLNEVHSSVLICPFTTNVKADLKILRVNFNKGMAGLTKDSDVLIDQIRALDKKRLISKLGKISKEQAAKVTQNLKIILDLDW